MPIKYNINKTKKRYDYGAHFFVWVDSKQDALNFVNFYRKIFPEEDTNYINHKINNFFADDGLEYFNFEIEKNKKLTERTFTSFVINAEQYEHIFVKYPDQITGICEIFDYDITPNYKPKKIKRTLNENVRTYELKSSESKPPETLSIIEQRKRFQIGDIVYIRTDSFDIYTDIGDYSMREYLGKMGKIVDVTTAREMYGFGTDFAGEGYGTLNPTDLLLSVKDPEDEFSEIWYWWYKCLINPKYIKPLYKPRRVIRTLERFNNFNRNDILYVFDMDDTLVYSDEFEDHIRPLLNENITPEEIFNIELDKINTDLPNLKYEHSRIYMDDPNKNIVIPKDSSWVRKKDRIYLTTPESYYMTTESIPNKVNRTMLDLYNSVDNKAIITARKEKYKTVTELALETLGIESPNYGLFMYPNETHSFKSQWKSDKLLELYDNDKFNEIHYYDDNIKLLKKMKHYLSKHNKNIYLYKVSKDSYRKI